jgi:N-acetylmuramoyl-L-alanine amidase
MRYRKNCNPTTASLAKRACKTGWSLLAPLLLSFSAIALSSPAAVAAAPETKQLAEIPPEAELPGGIMLVYPKTGALIAAPSTFLIGSCPAGSTLSCQGKPVKLSSQGYFAHVIELKPGPNTINLLRNNDPALKRQLTINRELPPVAISASQLTFAKDSFEPKTDVGLTAGDLLPLAVRATPGGRVEVELGARRIVLAQHVPGRKRNPQAATVNLGMDTAYGKVFQRQSASRPDLYYGFYRVRPDDHWQRIKPKLTLRANGRALNWTAATSLSTVEQPKPARTIHDETTVRLGPGQARTTPLPESVRLLIDGFQGDAMRCLLSAGHHCWILKEDLALGDESGPPPATTVRAVNLEGDGTGIQLRIPLTQRLPFQLEQQLNPNRIILKIFGATSDTDWIMQAPPVVNNALIDQVSWKQPADHLYELDVQLKPGTQWGFWCEYKETTLLLHIKGPPALTNENGPLSGAVICVDPGHGGSETGSIGPTGIKESTVNLAIATKLRDLLGAEGARVIMTRQSDSQFVSLADRVKLATDGHADLLISIHNNALPDGQDPWNQHGTSSYWYHPQATALARLLKSSLVKDIGLPDFGTNYQNLALCRPSGLVAVLVEVAFMINPDEYAQLVTAEFQQKVAQSLAGGIRHYLRPDKAGSEAELRTKEVSR